MRKILLLIPFLFVLSCGQPPQHNQAQAAEKEKVIYYCPMHPEVQQDHPGVCDKCGGMELVKKEPDEYLNMVLQPTSSSVLSNVKTTHPEKKEIEATIEAQGYIDYDERTRHDVSSVFDGRIEKLFVKYNYQPVRKGEKLFDVYSPELVTAQQNFLLLMNTDKSGSELTDAAKQKLKILGMTDRQIANLSATRKVQNSVTVYSNWDGHIHETKASVQANGGAPADNGMGGGGAPTAPARAPADPGGLTSIPLSTKEGMYVARGQAIFNIANPHEVVVVLRVKEQDIARVKVNQPVSLEISETPVMTMDGKINFIEPVIRAGEKTLTARVNLDNSEHNHKVGTLVTGHIKGEGVEGLWVPASAVIDLGRNKVVWVKSDGHFAARRIETGVVTRDLIEVTDGLVPSDEIAIEGHYLTDSEGFTKSSEK